MPYDLGGEAVTRYAASGYEADFSIPSRHVSDQALSDLPQIRFARSSPGHRIEPPRDLLDGHRVLLVEDSLIIALDAEDIVMRLGADEVSTAASVEAALDLLSATPPSLAILDVNLGSTNSFPIADELLKRDIPFIFATGYGEQGQFPDVHRGRNVVQKPYTTENLAKALVEIVHKDLGALH